MIQIRSSVFETNSSSMHSLVIKKSGTHYSTEEMEHGMWLHNGEWNIWRDEELTFGRAPFDCLATFEAKTRYAIASLCCWDHSRFEEIEKIVFEVVPSCTSIKLPNNWYWDDGDAEEKRICYGHVDEDILTPFLKQNNISLKEFLTNDKYVVIVDGDEYCIWHHIKDAGLVNVDEIEKEFG